MSQSVTTIGSGQTPAKGAERIKRKRTMPASRPAFIVLQMTDESGNVVPFDKKRLKLLGVERNAEKVLEMDEDANTFYLRVMVPAGTRAGMTNKPKDAA